MQRITTGAGVAVGGFLMSWLGQGIWRQSPDEVWAAVAVVAVLGAGAIVLERQITRTLSPVVRMKHRR